MDYKHETRLEVVVSKLRAAQKRNWPAISKATGVPEKTISKVAYQYTKDPRSSTIEALYGYFHALENAPKRRRKTDFESND